MMLELLEQLEGTSLASIARESLYGFQILVGIHIVGLIFSVGVLLWVDLRMLGLCLSEQRLSAVYRALAKWFIAGFAVMILSGAMLFAGFATSAYENSFFRIKIAVITLAGINAAVFHGLVKRLPERADSGTPSRPVQLAGMLSIVFWGVVILCGRMMSYTLF
jgi:Family of unknown function (DUF6644)